MVELEYTTSLEKNRVLPLSDMRLINLATYLTVCAWWRRAQPTAKLPPPSFIAEGTVRNHLTTT